MSKESIDFDNNLDNIIAGTVMIVTGAIGTAVNFAVMLMIVKTPYFHSAFGYISFSHLLAATAALLTGVFWTGPVTLFSFNESVTVSLFGAGVGQLMHLLWFVSMCSHIHVAINRLIAVAWPFLYNKLFTGRSLVCYISSAWIFSFLLASPHFWHDCWLWFDVKSISWISRATACTIITNKLYFYNTMLMCMSILSINTITFFFLLKRLKVLRQSGGVLKNQQMDQLKRNISLYIQGCISAIMVMTAAISTYFIPLASSKLQRAILSSLNYELILTSYGIILIIFNKTFRNLCAPRPPAMFRKTTTNN